MQMFVLIFAQSVAAPAAAVGNGTTLYSIWSQPTTRKTPPSSFPISAATSTTSSIGISSLYFLWVRVKYWQKWYLLFSSCICSSIVFYLVTIEIVCASCRLDDCIRKEQSEFTCTICVCGNQEQLKMIVAFKEMITEILIKTCGAILAGSLGIQLLRFVTERGFNDGYYPSKSQVNCAPESIEAGRHYMEFINKWA